MSARRTREIALIYPCDGLAKQIFAWARAHGDCAIRPVFARLLPEIRAAIRWADAVLVDATEDHARAIEAFAQSLGQLGAAGTAVYTEKMHDGLEMFVRSHGALLLLGPLHDADWEALLKHLFQVAERERPWGLVA